MHFKLNLLFLLLICILEIAQLTPVPYRKLSKEELNQIALKCIDEIGIEKSIIEDVLRTQNLPENDQKYKDYLACSYKKQGYLTPEGTKMVYSNLYQFLEEFYNSSDLEALDHCKRITAENAGELCFQNLKCILAGLHKIEADDDKQKENDIDTNMI